MIAFSVYIGMLLQGIVAAKSGAQFSKCLWCGLGMPLLISVVAMLGDGNLEGVLESSCVLFPMLYGGLCRKELLLRIDERLLLGLTLVFHYVYWTAVLQNPPSRQGETLTILWGVWLLSLFPTMNVLWEAFSREQYDVFRRGFNYGWFLVIDVSLMLIHCLSSALFPPRSTGQGLIFGFMAFPLAIQGYYLLMLLPSEDDSWKSAKEHARVLAQKHSTFQMKRKTAAFIVVGFGVFLSANSMYALLPHWLVSGIAISLLLSFAAPFDPQSGENSRSYLFSTLKKIG